MSYKQGKFLYIPWRGKETPVTYEGDISVYEALKAAYDETGKSFRDHFVCLRRKLVDISGRYETDVQLQERAATYDTRLFESLDSKERCRLKEVTQPTAKRQVKPTMLIEAWKNKSPNKLFDGFGAYEPGAISTPTLRKSTAASDAGSSLPSRPDFDDRGDGASVGSEGPIIEEEDLEDMPHLEDRSAQAIAAAAAPAATAAATPAAQPAPILPTREIRKTNATQRANTIPAAASPLSPDDQVIQAAFADLLQSQAAAAAAQTNAAAGSMGGSMNFVGAGSMNQSSTVGVGPNAKAVGAGAVSDAILYRSQLRTAMSSAQEDGQLRQVDVPASHRDATGSFRETDATQELQDLLDEQHCEKEARIGRYDTALSLAKFFSNLQRSSEAVVKLEGLCSLDTDKHPDPTAQQIADDDCDGEATGFLISSTLLMTNWHVFPNARTANIKDLRILFSHDTKKKKHVHYGVPDPDRFFWNDKNLDIAVVAWKPFDDPDAGQLRVKQPIPFKFIPVPVSVPKDDRLAVIGHPDGKEKCVSMHGCRYRASGATKKDFGDAHFILYTNDTQGGSSGSPVFDLEFNLIAVHHSAVPQLKPNGKQAFSQSGRKLYSCNRGTHVSSIFLALLERAKELKASGDAAKLQLLQEALKTDGLTPEQLAILK